MHTYAHKYLLWRGILMDKYYGMGTYDRSLRRARLFFITVFVQFKIQISAKIKSLVNYLIDLLLLLAQ